MRSFDFVILDRATPASNPSFPTHLYLSWAIYALTRENVCISEAVRPSPGTEIQNLSESIILNIFDFV